MALEFQIAFLGPDHSCAAWVTKTSSAGFPLDNSRVEFFGLPETFCKQFKTRLAKPRYIYNVRGHDFLSFVGQWKFTGGDGPLDTNQNIYNEIDDLRKFTTQEESKSKRAANPIVTFGPMSDSFFIDSFRLKGYRWRNLPPDLEGEIQDVVCEYKWVEKGRGKIWDVAINANGGWVMLLDQGRDWRMGGQLPEALQKALEEGKANGVPIARVFLNHQHPTEYVLLFSDGMVHAQLHAGFKIQLRDLLKPWSESKSKKNKNLRDSIWFKFTPSSVVDSKERQKRIAAYYARRGLFQHRRGNTLLARYLRQTEEQRQESLSIKEQYVRTLVLAHKYLREANELAPEDVSIQAGYVEVLKVVRNARYDRILEDRLGYGTTLTRQNTGLSGAFHEGDDDKKDFRNEYVWAIGKLRKRGSERLAKELEGDRMPITEIPRTSAAERGWSYVMATSMADFRTVETDDECETEFEPADNGDTDSIQEKSTEWSVHSLPVTLPIQVHLPPELRSFRNPTRHDVFDEVGCPPDLGEIDSNGSTVNLSLPPLRGKNKSGRGRNSTFVPSSRRNWDSESEE